MKKFEMAAFSACPQRNRKKYAAFIVDPAHFDAFFSEYAFSINGRSREICKIENGKLEQELYREQKITGRQQGVGRSF